jgi:hypothetical protein
MDSTGTYAYVCDGASPGSAVLTDDLAVYTPGLPDHRGGAGTGFCNEGWEYGSHNNPAVGGYNTGGDLLSGFFHQGA